MRNNLLAKAEIELQKKDAEISRLKGKLEREYENFISVRRDNIKILVRNAELKENQGKAVEIIKDAIYLRRAYIVMRGDHGRVEEAQVRMIKESEDFIKSIGGGK